MLFADWSVYASQILKFEHENVITHIKEYKVTESMEFV